MRALTGKFDILQKVADINMRVKYVLENSMKSILILLQTSRVFFACNLECDLHESCEQIEKCERLILANAQIREAGKSTLEVNMQRSNKIYTLCLTTPVPI